MPGVGVLSMVVWPAWAGAVNHRGQEPLFDIDYQRGQITWTAAGDTITGRATVEVPAGCWTHIIYTHHPNTPGYWCAAKLSHPIQLHQAGRIEVERITEADINPLAPDAVLHN